MTVSGIAALFITSDTATFPRLLKRPQGSSFLFSRKLHTAIDAILRLIRSCYENAYELLQDIQPVHMLRQYLKYIRKGPTIHYPWI